MEDVVMQPISNKFRGPIRKSTAFKDQRGPLIVERAAILISVMTFGYLVAAIYYYVQGVYLVKSYPYNTFLNVPWDRFTDFDNMVLMCRHLNPYNDHSKSGYPPFANLFFYPFSFLSMNKGFLIFIAIPVCVSFLGLFWRMRDLPLYFRLTAATILTLSYPILFAVDRGNLDLWVALALATFLFSYHSDSRRARDVSCCGLAIAIAFKIYPAPLLLLQIKDGRYIDTVKTLALALALTLVSASAFQGGAIHAFADFKHMMGVTDAYTKESIQHSSFNVGLFYAGVIVLDKLKLAGSLAWFVNHYWLIAGTFLISVSIAVARARITYVECACCLIALFCLAPSLSNDYRLVALVPIAVLLLFQHSESELRIRTTLTIIALLLVPKNYWHIYPEVSPGDITAASIVNPLLLILLITTLVAWKRAPVAAS